MNLKPSFPVPLFFSLKDLALTPSDGGLLRCGSKVWCAPVCTVPISNWRSDDTAFSCTQLRKIVMTQHLAFGAPDEPHISAFLSLELMLLLAGNLAKTRIDTSATDMSSIHVSIEYREPSIVTDLVISIMRPSTRNRRRPLISANSASSVLIWCPDRGSTRTMETACLLHPQTELARVRTPLD